MYGAGCWAYNYHGDSKPGVAVATSGKGCYVKTEMIS